MNSGELVLLLDRLLSRADEHEWVEWKHNNEEPHMIGEYISALSNAAALDGEPFGYMIWGVDDKTGAIVGTGFDPKKAKGQGAQPLMLWLHQYLRPKLDFRFESLQYQNETIVVLLIPSAIGQPTSFHEIEYIRLDSAKVKLRDHPDKSRRLWAMLSTRVDWSAELVSSASIDDLDEAAIAEGKEQYAKKNPRLIDEIKRWDVSAFLSKLKLTKGNKLTRAAILLFGKDESAQHLPHRPEISWILKDQEGTALDYHHFRLPFILAPDALFARIRNLTVRYLRPGTLFHTEVPQYDSWVIKEALHNCIAHQDYDLGGRVNVIEKPDELIFSNIGDFLPDSVESLLVEDLSPERYRNHCLAQAMVSLKMIDTIGSGIRRMYTEQRKRFFPMPDYLIDHEKQRVEVRIPGRILDEKYTFALMQQPELMLWDVFLLDKVQKRQPITLDEAKGLRRQNLIEGRAPNYFVSSKVAKAIGEQAQYTRNKGLEKSFYREMIVQHLRHFERASRKDLEQILIDKLPDGLTKAQKENKIKNLLAEMSKDKLITSDGIRGPSAVWKLIEK